MVGQGDTPLQLNRQTLQMFGMLFVRDNIASPELQSLQHQLTSIARAHICKRRFACWYENGVRPSVCLSVCLSARDVHCGKTVQDKPVVCIEVEQESGVEIISCTILDPLYPI